MDISEFIINNVATLNVFFALIAAVVTYLVFRTTLQEREKQEEKIEPIRKKFFETLLEGLKTGTIEKLNDVENIYVGVGGSSSEDYHYDLSKLLKEFLVKLISKELDESIENNVLIEWNKNISEFIYKIQEKSPYLGLPDIERNILEDISSYLETENNKDVERKLTEIAGIIKARNDDLNKIEYINKWAVPLAIIGVFLTLLFGLMSII